MNFIDPFGLSFWETLKNFGKALVDVGKKALIIGSAAIAIIGTIGTAIAVTVGSGGAGAAVAIPAVAIAIEAEITLAAASLTVVAAGEIAELSGEIGEKINKNPTNTNLREIKKHSEANEIAEKFGYKNAEELKSDFVSDESLFYMKIDKKTGEIILERINDSSIQVPTGLKVVK